MNGLRGIIDEPDRVEDYFFYLKLYQSVHNTEIQRTTELYIL